MKRNWDDDIANTSGTFSLGFNLASNKKTKTTATAHISSSAATGDERNLLEQLFAAHGGHEWITTANWNTDTPISTWHGISTNGEQHVTSISLSSNNLKGLLSDLVELVLHLPNLVRLDVSRNLLTGCKTTAMISCLDRFQWFDYSGNKVTTFYRAAPESSSKSVSFSSKETKRILCSSSSSSSSSSLSSSSVSSSSSSSPASQKMHVPANDPLCYVNLSPGIMSPDVCHSVIRIAEAHAASITTTDDGSSGWTSNRHASYATIDLDVRDTPPLLDICNHALQQAILPAIAQLFEVGHESMLEVDDLFVVKYEYDSTGLKKTQTKLAPHRDDSTLSFVINLNDKVQYQGGGTAFVDRVPQEYVACPQQVGTLVSFCGKQRHEGRVITKGIRYILAGFLKVHDDGGGMKRRAIDLHGE